MERIFSERIDIGERVLNHTEDEHRARYAWATDRVRGKVIDVACGTGHGSSLLARSCEVTGVDSDLQAVETARTRVPAGEFQQARVPPLPFPDDAFDAAVSFETLEHLDPDREFLSELRRVTVPGGHVLVSTPNRAASSPNDASPPNPFHVREYMLPELLELVRSAGFEQIGVFYQRSERNTVPQAVASAVLARFPTLCRPGHWLDRLGHGSGEVLPWRGQVTWPQFWVLDCS